jgi:retron-type reverse transcriptase
MNIASNAARHAQQNYLLRIDFQDFFPSITAADVMKALTSRAAVLPHISTGDGDLEVITKLVCRGGRLTIGAPTSPTISNAVMFEFDADWDARCRTAGVVYSRYADDICLSTSTPNVLASLLDEIRSDLKRRQSPTLRINEGKTSFCSRKRRRLVTGLVLSRDRKVSLGRKRKRHIKSLVFRHLRGELSPEERASLRGLLAYVRSVEPSFTEALHRKYGTAAIASV